MKKKLFGLASIALLILVVTALVGACAQPSPTAPAPATTSAASTAPAKVSTPASVAASSPGATSAPSATAKPVKITLRAVTASPTNFTVINGVREFFKRVNERSNGELTINLIGGPEVIQAPEIGKAVQGGVIDMAWVWATAYSGMVPASGDALAQSNLSNKEMRTNGFLEYNRQLHAKAGLYLLGRADDDPPMDNLWLIMKKPNRTLADFKGKKLGYTTIKEPNFWKALGISIVPVQTAERYTALETGLADIVPSAGDTIYGNKYYEVAPNILDRPFQTSNRVYIINMQTWNNIPSRLQTVLTNTCIEMEPWWLDAYKKTIQEQFDLMRKSKVEFVKLSADEDKWFTTNWADDVWKTLVTKYPDVGPKLNELGLKK